MRTARSARGGPAAAAATASDQRQPTTRPCADMRRLQVEQFKMITVDLFNRFILWHSSPSERPPTGSASATRR